MSIRQLHTRLILGKIFAFIDQKAYLHDFNLAKLYEQECHRIFPLIYTSEYVNIIKN